MAKRLIYLIFLVYSELSAQPFFKVYDSNLGHAPVSLTATATHLFVSSMENTLDDPFDLNGVLKLQKLDNNGTPLDSIYLLDYAWIYDSQVIDNHLYLAANTRGATNYIVVEKYNQQLSLLASDTVLSADTIDFILGITFQNDKLQLVFYKTGALQNATITEYAPQTKSSWGTSIPVPRTPYTLQACLTQESKPLWTYRTANPQANFLSTYTTGTDSIQRIIKQNGTEIAEPGRNLQSIGNKYHFSGYTNITFNWVALYVERGNIHTLVATDSQLLSYPQAHLGRALFKTQAVNTSSTYILSNYSPYPDYPDVFPLQDLETSYHITRLDSQLQPIWQHIEPTNGYNISPFLLALQPNGDVLVSGTVIKPSPNRANYRLFIARITANGDVSSLDIEKPINHRPIKLYPNPGTDILRWDLPETESTAWVLELYDMKGKKHLEVDGQSKETNTSALPPGIYQVVLTHPKFGRYSSRWVRN